MSSGIDRNKPGKMVIHHFLLGPFPARVRIALYEKGLYDLVEFKEINIFKGEQKTEEFLTTKNYSGTVPVLELADGSIISESAAITQYIDNLDGNSYLTGVTAFEQGRIHMMNRQVENEFLIPIATYFHHGTEGLGEVESFQIKEWGMKNKEKGIKGIYYLNKLLQTQPYIAGEKFTMADITAIGGILFCNIVKILIPEDCQAFKDWYNRVNEKESVKLYFKQFAIDSANSA